MSNLIQCLWIGRCLSPLEQLSIRSFLANGHEVHLYVYEQVEGVPHGTRIRNAERVLPHSSQFVYREYPSYAGFANFFRYRLLLEKGGWWVDLDTICLLPFAFAADYVFSSEDVLEGGTKANVGAIKVPAGSDLMAALWRRCEAFDVSKLGWNECGPTLMAEAIRQHKLDEFVQPPAAFCPLPWWEWRNALDAGTSYRPPQEAYAIHLWNEMWRRAGIDKFTPSSPGSLYALLHARFPAAREIATGRSRLGWSATWGSLRKYSPPLPAANDATSEGEPAGSKQSSMRISAVVLTKNGEKRIGRCLQSIANSGFADEIVVCIDRTTTDNTYEAARSLAHQVHFISTDGYLESALPQMAALCSGDFILRLDDDERLGGDWSRQEFESLVALNDLSHLNIFRRWIVDDGEKFIVAPPWFPDVQMRLFRNAPASIRWPLQIHQPMEIAGNGLTAGDRWIEHDVLFTASVEEREEKCRNYYALRPECHLSHYYLHEGHQLARLPANEQGFRAAMQILWAEKAGNAAAEFPYCEFDKPIRFEAGQAGDRYKLSGWSVAEPWGTWTEGHSAALQFYLRENPPGALLLVVDARAYTCPGHPMQSVRVECQNETLGLWTFDTEQFEAKSVVVPASALTGAGSLTIHFDLLNPASPAEFGESDDLRVLGMALRSLRLENSAVSEVTVGAAEVVVGD